MDKKYKEMIKKAIKKGACKGEIKFLTRFRDLEEFFNYGDIERVARNCVWYAQYIIGGRWLEGENVIFKSAPQSFWYCLMILEDRCFEAEKIILQSSECSYMYADYIIGGPWPEAEEIISKDNFFWRLYCLKE